MTTEQETPEGEARDVGELLALYEEWRRLEQIAISKGIAVSKGEEDAPWLDASDAEDRFYEAPALTLAGMLFKLRAACLSEVYEIEYAVGGKPAPPPQLRAVLRDLERMVGSAKVPDPTVWYTEFEQTPSVTRR